MIHIENSRWKAAWYARGIAWYRARLVRSSFCIICWYCCACSAGPCPCIGGKTKKTSTRRRGTAVPVRRDGLGIAVRRAVRLAAEASREGAQFRRRGAVRPLQPACHQEENAILFNRPRRNYLHSEHRDTTVKWCKSCPSRRARDDGLSSNFPFSLFPYPIVIWKGSLPLYLLVLYVHVYHT